MRRSRQICAGGLLALGAALPAQRADASRPARPDQKEHKAFDQILRATVHRGLIDYLAIRKDHRAALRGYLDAMAKVPVHRLGKPQQLTYYINLYNATMIAAVVDRLSADYTPAANEYGVFKEPLVRMVGKTVSLDDLENKIIRPGFDEPRIHVALVCGAMSCPPILPRAYRSKDLTSVLERNMRRFLRDKARNQVDVKKRQLRLSQIFQWYKVDFGGDEGLVQYVDRYTKPKVRGFAVEFLPYSWKLNILKPRAGTWASLRRVVGGLEKGAYVEVEKTVGETVTVRDAAGQRHTVEKSALRAFD